MELKRLRQILKALGDDTRLRIINLLKTRRLTVKEIHSALKISQPAASKHLITLRLLKIVNDKREGNFIYYSLSKDPEIEKIISFIFEEFKNLPAFVNDREKLGFAPLR
ncbi:MAG: metalloregulator ArsR/SmtB family transcription factor [Candidatus Omnitrophica bacterium]|nr:metalloregulator ArsR/SmtB family transcription factor [Candidatus Omnitrophota bacterium]MBU2044017.1 metalloregulator ArsR/SmtB family transcription factor [Candidatus Omnitrophota bacterium]MBU2251691.1 metalloregulator ArsR/SmtB family transcription factor [Candidatus Omnitrophota bacterium]MBU2473935.1 metalloregulator ArsR/SmtB family transcription factor [Candidatus Omnitrophota bacterium]